LAALGPLQGDAHRGFVRTAPLHAALALQGGAATATFTTTAADGSPAAVDARRVLAAWEAGESHVPLLEGGFAPLPADWLGRYGDHLRFLLAARDADGKAAPWALPALAQLCTDLDEPTPQGLDGVRALVDGGFDRLPPPLLPPDLRASLRDYQRTGVAWLQTCRRAGLGALLADDMGLGKTLQALTTFVAGERTLVVAPTSVLHGWLAELARFRPALRVHRYHGPRRALDPEADVTVTTYAILRLDAHLLRRAPGDVPWDMLVLDEAQAIKNPESQVADAAFQVDARARLALTGTPVENRLDELWSLFHLLDRGLLGGRQQFQERFARPIADGAPGAAARLRARIRPFILRRKKSEVARELPPRTEVVLRCQLSQRERELYDALRLATREEVVAELEAGKGVLQALEALLRLRQAACHRALIPGQEASSSAKVDLLVDTLDEIVAEGHKALVFSQWTGLLDKVEPALRAQGLAFTRLDGSTRDRAAVVSAFQDPQGPPVMLISLKAGGTGLTLTAADHVFLLDPWWNPAVEDQAADRAHRIGQDRPVLVHRLVAEDTVEERILALQEQKRAIADAALGEADAAAGLSRQDLLALLE
ncbi:MAG TPA: DEAD/DEAH box helicase, partial [Nannocystaceae bacterium]|nr:DEAD/DEAH box helicase [Nannocystaceae bacterium]